MWTRAITSLIIIVVCGGLAVLLVVLLLPFRTQSAVIGTYEFALAEANGRWTATPHYESTRELRRELPLSAWAAVRVTEHRWGVTKRPLSSNPRIFPRLLTRWMVEVDVGQGTSWAGWPASFAAGASRPGPSLTGPAIAAGQINEILTAVEREIRAKHAGAAAAIQRGGTSGWRVEWIPLTVTLVVIAGIVVHMFVIEPRRKRRKAEVAAGGGG